MAKTCNSCGAPLEDGVSVCAGCGAEEQPLPNEPHFATAAEHEAYLQGLREAGLSVAQEAADDAAPDAQEQE